MASEKFCLRWNDFETNISEAFKELKDDKEFYDITLACDDEQVQAHKMILSACSPFFRSVLRRNPHQHPLLYLKGVKFSDLQSVLSFMYNGEVSVAQEELNSFLAVAEDLKVKGLTQSQSESKSKTSFSSQDIKSNTSHRLQAQDTVKPTRPQQSTQSPLVASYTSKPATYQPSNNRHSEDEIQEVVPVKSEPRDLISTTSVQQQHHSEYVDDSQSLAPVGDELYYQEEQYADYEHYQDQTDYTVQEGNTGKCIYLTYFKVMWLVNVFFSRLVTTSTANPE